VENIANFLSYLYTEGYEYSTINSYRSAISAIHPEIGVGKVGQHNTIKQVMAGIFNKHPHLPRYTKTWNVDLVLNHIQGMPENKELELKDFTLKTSTLMALTSAARASENWTTCKFHRMRSVSLKLVSQRQERLRTLAIMSLFVFMKTTNWM
jgi:hypothetical protein